MRLFLTQDEVRYVLKCIDKCAQYTNMTSGHVTTSVGVEELKRIAAKIEEQWKQP